MAGKKKKVKIKKVNDVRFSGEDQGLLTLEQLEQDNTEPINESDFYDDTLPEVKNGEVFRVARKARPHFWQFWKKKEPTLKIPAWDRRKLKKKPDISFLIKMKFSNGTTRYFVIATKDELFTYKGRSYYLRHQDSWFNINTNQYELEFFDDAPVPISKKLIQVGDKSFHAVNSENLKPLFLARKAEILASAQNIDRFMRNILLICLFIAFLVFITMFLVYKNSKAIGLLGGV